MIKKEITEIIEMNKNRRTKTLKEIKAQMEDIISERELTKSMYFWSPADNAPGRRWNEKRRNITRSASLKGLDIEYERDYSESCRYVYASDTLDGRRDGKWFKVTVADLKKLIAGIDAILVRRKVAIA